MEDECSYELSLIKEKKKLNVNHNGKMEEKVVFCLNILLKY
jgi:hypothetical protein